MRDVDRWYASFEATVLACIFGPGVDWFVKGVGTVVGHRAGFAMRKALTGFFGGADTLEDFRAVGKKVYLAHYEHVKAMVPEERLLVYRVGKDGWEPLCRFLDKPVPERRDFPFINEGQAYDRLLRGVYWRYCRKAAVIVAPYLAVALVVTFMVLVWVVDLWGQ